MRPLVSVFIISVLGFALAGCATKAPPATTVVAPTPTLKAEPEQAQEVLRPEEKLANRVDAVSVARLLTTADNNQLVLQAEIHNRLGRRVLVDYRVRWLDANGLQVTAYDPWSVLALEGKESSLLRLQAPRPEATDFRLEIQPHN